MMSYGYFGIAYKKRRKGLIIRFLKLKASVQNFVLYSEIVGEEILFQSIIEDHFLFVNDLIYEGANILENNSRNISVFLVAAKCGSIDAGKILLNFIHAEKQLKLESNQNLTIFFETKKLSMKHKKEGSTLILRLQLKIRFLLIFPQI